MCDFRDFCGHCSCALLGARFFKKIFWVTPSNFLIMNSERCPLVGLHVVTVVTRCSSRQKSVPVRHCNNCCVIVSLQPCSRYFVQLPKSLFINTKQWRRSMWKLTKQSESEITIQKQSAANLQTQPKCILKFTDVIESLLQINGQKSFLFNIIAQMFTAKKNLKTNKIIKEK